MIAKTVREEEQAIIKRFFEAIYILRKERQIRSLSGLCNEIGLSAPMYRSLRLYYGIDAQKDTSECAYKSIDMIALYHIVVFYGISAEWLLTGKGEIKSYKR